MCSFDTSDTNYTLSCHSQCVTPDLTLLTCENTTVNRLLFITLANKVLQTVILLTLPYKGNMFSPYLDNI